MKTFVDNTKNALKKPKKRWFWRLLKLACWGLVAFLLFAIGVFAYYAKDLAKPDQSEHKASR